MKVFFKTTCLGAVLFALLAFKCEGEPLTIVGFGNSISCEECNDGSYLGLVGAHLVPPPADVVSQGMSANTSGVVLARFRGWVEAGGTADVVVLLTGTPDVYHAVGGWGNRPYDPEEVVGNVEALIHSSFDHGIPVILLAPPPVLEPCDRPELLTCAEIDDRLADLAGRLGVLAEEENVVFLDLHAEFKADPRFGRHPGPDSLLLDDGLHPRSGTGDALIAERLAAKIPRFPVALIVYHRAKVF
jgi:lysophospholipase L1-like esterase